MKLTCPWHGVLVELRPLGMPDVPSTLGWLRGRRPIRLTWSARKTALCRWTDKGSAENALAAMRDALTDWATSRKLVVVRAWAAPVTQRSATRTSAERRLDEGRGRRRKGAR